MSRIDVGRFRLTTLARSTNQLVLFRQSNVTKRRPGPGSVGYYSDHGVGRTPLSTSFFRAPPPLTSTHSTDSSITWSLSMDLSASELSSPVCYLSERDILPASPNMTSSSPLRIGYVPEHFSTPIHFAKRHFGLSAELVPFPSGTGHMITALRAGEIDVGIGLTEGWIAGLGRENPEPADGGYRLVGTYVETPLCWAISTGTNRAEITGVESLKGGKIGVSRIGSGSYVMGYVLADQQGWLSSKDETQSGDKSEPFKETVVLNTFANLRRAVNNGEADFFMWEHFTSKKYYDNGEIRRVGEIYTPWSSWKIVASTALIGAGNKLDERVEELFRKLNEGIKYFNEHLDEAVNFISTELDYSEVDAREWLKTVRFPENTRGVDMAVVDKTVGLLCKAGVLVQGKGMQPEDMTLLKR